MKKFFSLLIMLCCAIGMNAATYDIWVKGVQVTDANKNDVLGDGKVSYDPSNYMLTLVNAKITGSTTAKNEKDAACIYVQQRTNIDIQGDVTLTTTGDYPAFIENGGYTVIFATTTKPYANLTVKSATTAMKFYGKNTASFKSINVSVTGGSYGIWAESDHKFSLTNCDFYVVGASNSAPIYGFGSVTTEGTSLSDPTDLTYDTTSRYYKQNGSLYKGSIQFSAEYYGITVAGTKVTSRTKDYILGVNNTKAQYDPSTKTLTLNNATITASSTNEGISIESDADIKLVGTNTIKATGGAGSALEINKGCTTTISSDDGTGVLDFVNTTKPVGLYNLGTFTISNCAVNAITSGNYGISGQGSGTLIINSDATLTAQGAKASVYNLAKITLNDVEIISPSGAKISSGAVVDANGNLVTDKVTITANVEYGITVGGKKVNTANKDNILGDSKKTVTYDPATKTITLNNATIMNDGSGISTDDDGDVITINLIGTNSITSQKSYGLYLSRKATITSTADGKLTVNAYSNAGIWHSKKLATENCSLEVSGYGYGFKTNAYTAHYSIYINNANVKAHGTNGAFYGYYKESLTNCYVATADAHFDGSQESTSGYVDSSSALCKDIEIKVGTSGIEGVTIEEVDNAPIYDLRGIQVGNNFKGIVIKNGKKYIQR